MRHTVLAAIFALSASALLGFGCGSGAAPSANSFTKIYTETIQQKCTTDFCHYNGEPMRLGALDLSSQVRAYWSLVNQPCIGTSCNQMGTRVVPGDPGSSMLFLKVQDPEPAPLPCGSEMPADINQFLTYGNVVFIAGTALLQEKQDLIQNWIQDGAQNN